MTESQIEDVQTDNVKINEIQNDIEKTDKLKLDNDNALIFNQLNENFQINDDTLDIILNPHVYTIDDTLKELEKSVDVDYKNTLIEELVLVFLKDDILYCKNIQERFPKLLDLLKKDEIYHTACILISDIVRHKPIIQNIFFKLGIFELLKFKYYKPTVSVVFGMCYENKEIWDYFYNNYYDEERDKANELMCILKNE